MPRIAHDISKNSNKLENLIEDKFIKFIAHFIHQIDASRMSPKAIVNRNEIYTGSIYEKINDKYL